MKYDIAAENITHSFSGENVLDNVSFRIEKGEIFGLLGPSVARKTTLIKILTGQLQQKGGSAQLLGTDTGKLQEEERRSFGTMMDNFGLYERLSVQDNMIFYSDIYGMPRRRIDEILKSIGLYEAKKTAVSRLSKGMKNRLSLARALMNDKKILFLDEPTSGLDPVTSREIHSILKEQRDKGVTIFLTTHNMFEAENLCDRVALLYRGKIIECGKPEAVCRKYDRLNKLHITLKDGRKITLENNASAADTVAGYLKREEISAVHSTEPTLESVFIELTGKGLS